MMMSFNNNIKNKINALNNNNNNTNNGNSSNNISTSNKLSSLATKPAATTNIKVSNSISEKIKKLSTSSTSSTSSTTSSSSEPSPSPTTVTPAASLNKTTNDKTTASTTPTTTTTSSNNKNIVNTNGNANKDKESSKDVANNDLKETVKEPIKEVNKDKIENRRSRFESSKDSNKDANNKVNDDKKDTVNSFKMNSTPPPPTPTTTAKIEIINNKKEIKDEKKDNSEVANVTKYKDSIYDTYKKTQVSDPKTPNNLTSDSFVVDKNSSGHNSVSSESDYPFLAEEEDSSISLASSTLQVSVNLVANTDSDDLKTIKEKLAEVQYINKQLKLENETLHEELQDIRHEMEELQDQFRLDDADEFRQLQAELEIAAKNCRILQFKLRKLEKKNENLETEKLILQDKLDEFSREATKIIDLEEELLIAKEVSIRLNGELEQAQEWRSTTEKLNKELKKQLDDLKDYLDNEIKNRNATEDYNELVLVNKLYESMFREYFLQEQLYSLSSNSQSQNVTKQLREVNDLINSYQQKIAILNEEIDILKQQLTNKDKEMDQLKIQLKNLKRSRSSDSSYDRNRRQLNANNAILNGKSNSNTSLDTTGTITINNSNCSSDETSTIKNNISEEECCQDEKQGYEQTTESVTAQLQMANDEIRLLRNKIARLEDDLSCVTQEKDNLTSQLEKIEDKAMKSFTTIVENEPECDLDLDTTVIKQMSELKKKIDQLNVEAKTNEETKNKLSAEIKQLKDQLDQKLFESVKNESIKNLKEEKQNENNNDNNDKLLKRDDSDSEVVQKNLTDADKLLRDECKLLKSELDDCNDTISKLQSELKQNSTTITELKKLIDVKEKSLSESIEKENSLNKLLVDSENKLNLLNKKIQDYEVSLKNLKSDYEQKINIESEITSNNKNLSLKITDLNTQLQEKVSEIDFLNRENNALQERVNSDDIKFKKLESDLNKLRFKIDDLNTDLETKNKEVIRLEKTLKSKENEYSDIHRKITGKEASVKDKLEEFEKNRIELVNLRAKFSDLSVTLEEKVNTFTKEIERLNKEKESLYIDLIELKNKHEKCHLNNNSVKSDLIENEINHEKAILQKLEIQAVSTKFETKIQYLEVEVDTLRSKIKKLLREKETQDQVLKENQKLVKEIALKYATDSDAWNRQKQKLLEKEKLYEESVDMRKELKKAADKLRQKLQSLEEQIIDKQNKHTMEKNNWETQKIQFMSANNKLEEQLSKLSTLKRSKKEIDFAWDKERKEFINQIQNLETFVKELQSQLAQKNNSISQMTDQYGQNEKIQSLIGENEFLKNRIRELEIMLDEMDQVKRFLFDVKEAYDLDRQEWMYAKDEFRNQLDIKEHLLAECNMKLSEIINVVRAMLTNEPIPPNVFGIGTNKELSINDDSSTSSKNQSLNNLVGGTSNLLELKFGQQHYGNGQLRTSDLSYNQTTPSKLNISHLKSLNGQSDIDNDEIQILDITKDRKELDSEFDQAFKKINRVKENLSTHKKFMDIVKSKSMKALNRKSSITSLPMNEEYLSDARGSVPPENKLTTSSSSSSAHATPRAKSVSKEPGARDGSTSVSSRFFSLGRRFAKIRFSSSSQPPPPVKSLFTTKSTSNIASEDTQKETNLKTNQDKKSKQMTQSQLLVPSDGQDLDNLDNKEDDKKKNLRERALSPSRLLRSLRPRSPFGRTNRNVKASSLAPTSTTMISGTSGDKSGKNKSFTVGVSSEAPVESSSNVKPKTELLMSASYHSGSTYSNIMGEPSPSLSPSSIVNRFVRATTAAPTTSNERSNLSNMSPNEKLRSLSCEFIDNNSSTTSTSNGFINPKPHINNALKQLNETLDEYDESDNNSNVTASSYSTQGATNLTTNNSNSNNNTNRPQKLNLGLSSSSTSKVEMLRKNFMENPNCLSQNSEVVKSVKFKEPPEKVSPDATDNETSLSKNSDETNGVYTQKEVDSTSDQNTEKDKVTSLNPLKKLNVKFGSTTTSSDEPNSKLNYLSQQRLKTSLSTNNVDKPPKGPAQQLNSPNTSTFSFRNKFTSNKSKTIDFPDLLQSAIESTSNNQKSKNALLTPSGKPIQSILRRSETPPSTKTGSQRQTSIDSNESGRETSIEKFLKTTSTSRPLMFNN